jgi:hypothetical protein
MTTFRLTVVLLLACLLFPRGADAEDEADPFAPEALEGLEAAVYREYSAGGFLATALGTPNPGFQLTIQALVYDFASSDDAHAILDLMAQQLEEFVEEATGEERAAIVRNERGTAWGDASYDLGTTETGENGLSHNRIMIVADGEILFLLFAEAFNEDLFGPTDDLMTYLADTGAPDGEPAFDEGGGSTGGLWGYFPPADDPAVAGLFNLADRIVFPVPAGTAEA